MPSVSCDIFDPFHFQRCGHSLTAVNIHKIEPAMKPKCQHTTKDIIIKQNYKILYSFINYLTNIYR